MRPDLFSPAVVRDPYPAYARLQRETPVLHDAASSLWLVSRYADVARVLSEPEVFSSIGAAVTDILMGQDAPEHPRVRRGAQRSVSPSAVRSLEEMMRAYVRNAIGRASHGRLEIVEALAVPLPFEVMASLLGVPRERLREMHAAAEAMLARDAGGVHRGNELMAAQASRLGEQFPKLDDRERVAVAMLFNVAGTETTRHIIGNAVLLLARDAAAQARLRQREELIEPFLEEALRFETPVQRVWRVTTQATRVGNVAIPAKARLGLLLGAANRDPEAFPRAHAFEPERSPNRHLAFGVGPHFCIGARLARLQATVVVSELLRAGQGISLARPAETVPYLETTAVRGPARLEIQLSR